MQEYIGQHASSNLKGNYNIVIRTYLLYLRCNANISYIICYDIVVKAFNVGYIMGTFPGVTETVPYHPYCCVCTCSFIFWRQQKCAPETMVYFCNLWHLIVSVCAGLHLVCSDVIK